MSKEKCKSCEALVINGVYCHETGCPDKWRTTTLNCKWCGREFIPEEYGQVCCDEDCNGCYRGV